MSDFNREAGPALSAISKASSFVLPDATHSANPGIASATKQISATSSTIDGYVHQTLVQNN